MASTYGDRIHFALRKAAKAELFLLVKYPHNCRVTDAQGIKATTILINELSSSFTTPQLNRLTYRREKAAWVWELILHFDQAVSLEAFERSLVESPPVVARDPGIGLDQQVILLLEDVEYRHPPTQDPSSGTRVRYRFTALLSPV